MQEWAARQPGMKDASGAARISRITDGDGSAVTAKRIKDAINQWVNDGTIEQLIVYFAGHGANVRYAEYWLLSGAPDDANEAVNVEGTIPIARQCGVPHVVLMSDACRTAAASIQAQAVLGTIVFPNNPPNPSPGRVDVFYATRVGKPALEVSDPTVTGLFDAIYTAGVVQGLDGQAKVDDEREGAESVRRVRAWSLHRYLETAIPTLLKQKGVNLTVSQSPDSIITSPPEYWLSQLAPVRVTRGARSAPAAPPPAPSPGTVIEPTIRSVSEQALREALSPAPPAPAPQQAPPPESARPPLRRSRGARRDDALPPPGGGPPESAPARDLFAATLNRTGVTPGPAHFESGCGFKVNGIAIADVVSTGGRVDLMDKAAGLVRFWDVPQPATNVLVVFADGRGALLPAIPDYVTVLTYESDADGELANVTYEPSDTSQKWRMLQHDLPALRELRRVVATATRLGVFRLDASQDQLAFINRLREAKGLDPTMGVYAAYALHALQQEAAIAEIDQAIASSLNLRLFDVAMLAGGKAASAALPAAPMFPAVPLLSQGWALLQAFDVPLPSSLKSSLYRHTLSSLWTLFDDKGVAMIRAAITNREIV
jgi:hypothetical protein